MEITRARGGRLGRREAPLVGKPPQSLSLGGMEVTGAGMKGGSAGGWAR
jgi:hypothetical protein